MVDKLLAEQILADQKKPFGPILGIFAKEPLPGQVKTRLCPPLTATEAAELYRVSLTETVARMSRWRFELILFHSGHEDFFRTTFPGLQRIPQGGGNLGERMERALERLFTRGHSSAALMGSDSPDLPIAYVENAFATLQQADVVTIPADDGGYALIGERRHQPALFHAIPWSTPEVLAETRRRAKELAITYRELSFWDDVDDFASLKRLLQRSPGSATARFARTRFACYL